MSTSTIALNGLILAGGSSSRMQSDKGSLPYHGMPQYQYLYNLLLPFCQQVFISGRKEIDYSLPTLHDKIEYENYGPLAGVLTAFDQFSSAWLIVAVDYPLFREKEINHLVKERDNTYDSTVYFDYEKQFFEPFLGIYEPNLLQFIKLHAERFRYSSQKILQQGMVKKIIAPQAHSLLNINTKDGYDEFIISPSTSDESI